MRVRVEHCVCVCVCVRGWTNRLFPNQLDAALEVCVCARARACVCVRACVRACILSVLRVRVC